jgi:ABC-type sugar transport system ATPase subunit
MNLVPAPVLEGVGGDDRIVGFRPEHVQIRRNGARGDVISFDGRVEVVEYLGDEQLVHFTRKDTSLQAKLPVEEKVGAGDTVTLTLPREKLYLFDRESEQRVGS